jgi:hypothetical protein
MPDPIVEQTQTAPAPAQAATDAYIVQARNVGRRFGEGDTAVDALTDVSADFQRDR